MRYRSMFIICLEVALEVSIARNGLTFRSIITMKFRYLFASHDDGLRMSVAINCKDSTVETLDADVSVCKTDCDAHNCCVRPQCP